MNAKKLNKILTLSFFIGLVLSALLLRYASNWLTESSKELVSLRNEVSTLEQKKLDLERAKKTLTDRESDIETLEKVLPTDKDQARVVKEVYQIASEAGISIESVGFPSSTLGSETPKVATPTTTDSTATSTSTTTGSSSNTATNSSTTPPPAPKSISQATPVKDNTGVQSIDLTLGALNSTSLPPASGMRYSEMIRFIRLLERNQRTIQIRSVGIGQDKTVNGEPTYSLDIALTIFIRS